MGEENKTKPIPQQPPADNTGGEIIIIGIYGIGILLSLVMTFLWIRYLYNAGAPKK